MKKLSGALRHCPGELMVPGSGGRTGGGQKRSDAG